MLRGHQQSHFRRPGWAVPQRGNGVCWCRRAETAGAAREGSAIPPGCQGRVHLLCKAADSQDLRRRASPGTRKRAFAHDWRQQIGVAAAQKPSTDRHRPAALAHGGASPRYERRSANGMAAGSDHARAAAACRRNGPAELHHPVLPSRQFSRRAHLGSPSHGERGDAVLLVPRFIARVCWALHVRL
ncbi:hypothetical protein T492DRAFT_959342 [Pavlovales sp. CCMP2436]|nr:hypothetical protein T492DRAFT_959342 [Pavlovales sp. CCMP2436]